MTKTGRQSTKHHEMHTEEDAMKKKNLIYDFFSGRREPPLLVGDADRWMPSIVDLRNCHYSWQAELLLVYKV